MEVRDRAAGVAPQAGHKTQQIQGACLASLAAAAASMRRRSRAARVPRAGLSDNPWAERKFGEKPPKDPDDEDEDETLERKKPVEESEYCCWVTPKKEASEILKGWAEQDDVSDEQKDILQSLSEVEFNKDWTVWGICHISVGSDPGFYIFPPSEPAILAVMEANGEDQCDVHHVAANPSALGKNTKQAFLDWVESLRPKTVVVKRPKELYTFDMGVEEGDGKGIKKGSGPKVSKGL